VESMMSAISDGVKHDRLERETFEDRMEDRLVRLEGKVKENTNVVDNLTEIRLKGRIKESVKEMEVKVAESQRAVKLLNVDIGRETGDRREIVRKTIDILRSGVRMEDVGWLDRVMKRTRIVLLGKGTVRREYRGQVEFTVPTLFQCRDVTDAEDLANAFRDMGYFPSFHWPQEMLDFVEWAREEVRSKGCGEQEYFVKVRPEKRDGVWLIKAEAKLKNGGRYTVKGLWSVPPFHKVLWDESLDAFKTRLTDRLTDRG